MYYKCVKTSNIVYKKDQVIKIMKKKIIAV